LTRKCLRVALAYPALAWLTVDAWPRVPMFGVPGPTALFTTGCLFAAVPPVARGLLVIPILWSLIGGAAAGRLGIRIDLALFAAAVAVALLVLAVAPEIVEGPDPGRAPWYRSDGRGGRAIRLVGTPEPWPAARLTDAAPFIGRAASAAS
jgi:Family of unknown function (DUF6064)